MTDQFVGEIRPLCFNFAPFGWALCQGQLLPISQNTALFSLLGTQFGGNGTTNFALPDLRSCVPLGMGQAAGGDSYVMGETGGVETVTLTTNQMPAHNHTFSGTNAVGGHAQPATGGALGTENKGDAFYATDGASLIAINPNTVSPYGGNASHTNLQPYLAINWCIALTGVFPSRS